MFRPILAVALALSVSLPAAVIVQAAPTQAPGGGAGTTCDDTYKSCKTHCSTYGRDSSAFQTCITNCKTERDRCKAPTTRPK